MGGARSKNSIFRVFMVPSTILCTAYRKQFYPQTNDTDGKPKTLKVCLWLVWKVCDQAFGRRVPKSGHVPSRKLKICMKVCYSHRFQKCYSFRSTTKNNEVIEENRFRTVASPGACERLAVSSSIHPSGFIFVFK